MNLYALPKLRNITRLVFSKYLLTEDSITNTARFESGGSKLNGL